MNREIDQIKDLNKLDKELNALIGNLSKEGATARTKLESSVTESQKKSKKEVDDALAAASKKADENIRKALAEVASSAKKSTEELNKFKVATESTVAGLAAAVPAASCTNKKKDGDETDVDCGGACGNTCARGKKCKYTSDCGDSVCLGSVCNTCKGRTGTVALSPGRTAYCESNQLRPTKGKEYLRFSTCGKTRDMGPTRDDCEHHHSYAPELNSLHSMFTEHKWGFQVFTAPIAGSYTWYLYGAQGGDDVTCCRHYRNDYKRGAKGGYGGRVISTLNNVKAGTKFYIRVGQRGNDCFETKSGMRDPTGALPLKNCQYNPSGYAAWDNGKAWTDPNAWHQGFGACGGFNGGGPAICNHNPGGASGGGGTDIRMCKMGEGCLTPPDLKKRFLVSGGGGGGACEGNDGHGCGSYSRHGGHGGGLTGEQGYDNGHVGYGGSQTRGGRHQGENSKDHGSSWGTLGMGGTGGENDAGGGGGGYFGGGGARYNSGGGGGSSYIGGTSASGKPQTHNNDRGNHRGDGQIDLRITPA